MAERRLGFPLEIVAVIVFSIILSRSAAAAEPVGLDQHQVQQYQVPMAVQAAVVPVLTVALVHTGVDMGKEELVCKGIMEAKPLAVVEEPVRQVRILPVLVVLVWLILSPARQLLMPVEVEVLLQARAVLVVPEAVDMEE